MAAWPAFIGPAYRDRSPIVNAESLVNLYVSTVESEGSSKRRVLTGTPGLKTLLTVADVGCRGLWSQDGLTVAVVGDTLYQLDLALPDATTLGTILNDGLPVSFASNGRGGEQLAICGGGEVKILDLETLTLSSAVVLPFTSRPTQLAFIDGYFLLAETGTVRVWFSALEDGTSWDALDFFARNSTADNVVGIMVLRDRVWVFGSQTTELYYDSGDADTPFVPYPGSVFPLGLVSPYPLTTIGGAGIWLAQSAQGGSHIVMATEASPQVISTPAVAYALSTYATVADAEAMSYEQDGHAFAVFTFPAADKTWSYDLREGVWHERGAWDVPRGEWHRWTARGCCAVNGQVLVGDVGSGNLYTLDLDTFTDAGEPLRRVRRAPYISLESQWLFLDQFELGIESGVGLTTGQGSDPQLQLAVSRDGAKTWTSAGFAPMGPLGDHTARTIWRRLGRARGDRLVLEVSQTDPVRACWTSAFLRVTNGTGQL